MDLNVSGTISAKTSIEKYSNSNILQNTVNSLCCGTLNEKPFIRNKTAHIHCHYLLSHNSDNSDKTTGWNKMGMYNLCCWFVWQPCVRFLTSLKTVWYLYSVRLFPSHGNVKKCNDQKHGKKILPTFFFAFTNMMSDLYNSLLPGQNFICILSQERNKWVCQSEHQKTKFLWSPPKWSHSWLPHFFQWIPCYHNHSISSAFLWALYSGLLLYLVLVFSQQP